MQFRSTSDSDHDDCHPDSPLLGSPDVTGFHLSPPALLSDDLRFTIIKQVEYYFSDENLPNDKFMMKYVARNNGYVPIGVIASFRKMKKLTTDMSLIVAALKESALVVVSSNGKKVKRLHPLPLADAKDPMVCTILVENLPEDHSVENLNRVFGEAGKIKNITIHDPYDAKELKKCTVAEKLICGKLHALVEYDTVEAAEKAVSLLNNEQDWRYGLRVKLLKKVARRILFGGNQSPRNAARFKHLSHLGMKRIMMQMGNTNHMMRRLLTRHQERKAGHYWLKRKMGTRVETMHLEGDRNIKDRMDMDMEHNFPFMVMNHANLHQAQKCPMEPEGLPWEGDVPQLPIEA